MLRDFGIKLLVLERVLVDAVWSNIQDVIALNSYPNHVVAASNAKYAQILDVHLVALNVTHVFNALDQFVKV
jgi:hypothetical protein